MIQQVTNILRTSLDVKEISTLFLEILAWVVITCHSDLNCTKKVRGKGIRDEQFTWYPCWVDCGVPASLMAKGINCICMSGCKTFASLLIKPPLSKWFVAQVPSLNKNH